MSEEEKKETKSGFRVEDRRQFKPDGEMRPKATEAKTPSATGNAGGEKEGATVKDPASRPAEPAAPPPGSSAETGKKKDAAPPIDFASFVLSLATTAMVHLGEVPDPVAGKPQENLAAARQMVDLLNMLKEKTEGNRTPEENRLMEEILYELRMKVLSKSKAIHL